VPVQKTVSVIDQKLADLNKPGAIKNEKLTQVLQRVKDDLLSGEQDLSLLRQNRTRFREEIKGESIATSTTEDRIINDVYKAMTDDMVSAVRSSQGDKVAESLRQADAVWAREANTVKKTKIKNILNKGDVKPEEATKMLFSNDAGEIKSIYGALDSTGRQKARAAVINKAFESSQGSPDRFVNEMRKLRKQNEVFFKGKDGQDLNGLISYLEHTKQASRAAVQTPTGQQLFQIGAPVAVMGDVAATGGAGTAGFAAYGALARAYESPKVRNIMARMSSIKPGSTEFEKLASQLEAIMAQSATRAQGSEE